MLLCRCPGDNAGAGRRRSGDQPFPRHHKVLTNRGSSFRPPGQSARFDTDAPFPCPPQPPAAPKHGWVSLHPHPAALQGPEQPGRAARVGALHQDPQEGAAEGRDGGAGLVTPLAGAAGSATGDSRWPVSNAPSPAGPVSLSHRPQSRGKLSPCVTAREPPGRDSRPRTRQMSSGTPRTSLPKKHPASSDLR